ncbi:MAG: hypothetical protein GXP42_02065 [Chloroflexi bacterium]|nr:hypothetical protein [Chloroflexota bacterium]
MDLYERAAEGMTKVESFVSNLPVIKDYRNKEMRRDADKRLREFIAEALERSRRRLTAAQLDLVRAGNLQALPKVEQAVGRLQLLIDRIRTAGYGYAPFFDIDEVREAELDKLAEFDRQIGQKAEVIGQQTEALALKIRSEEPFDEALDAFMDELAALHQRFDSREQLLSSVG